MAWTWTWQLMAPGGSLSPSHRWAERYEGACEGPFSAVLDRSMAATGPVPALTGPPPQLQARIATLGVGFAGVKLMQSGSGPRGRARWHCLRDIRRQLRDWPYLGSNSQEHPGCRYFVCEGLLIVYQVEPDTGDTSTSRPPRADSIEVPKPGGSWATWLQRMRAIYWSRDPPSGTRGGRCGGRAGRAAVPSQMRQHRPGHGHKCLTRGDAAVSRCYRIGRYASGADSLIPAQAGNPARVCGKRVATMARHHRGLRAVPGSTTTLRRV